MFKGYFPKTGNQKVKNATKTVVDGVRYDSKLEAYFSGLLSMHRIPFELKRTVELQPGFVFNGKKIRPITIIPDFYLTDQQVFVDTKGHLLETSAIKLKMLKKVLLDTGTAKDIILLKNRKECEKYVLELLRG